MPFIGRVTEKTTVKRSIACDTLLARLDLNTTFAQ